MCGALDLTRKSSAAAGAKNAGAPTSRSRLQRLVRPLLRQAPDFSTDPKLVLVFLGEIWQWSIASFYDRKWSVWEYGEKHPVLWWVNLPTVMLSGEPCTHSE